MNLHYKGDFLLKIDADMVLGKKGSLSLRGKDEMAFELFKKLLRNVHKKRHKFSKF